MIVKNNISIINTEIFDGMDVYGNKTFNMKLSKVENNDVKIKENANVMIQETKFFNAYLDLDKDTDIALINSDLSLKNKRGKFKNCICEEFDDYSGVCEIVSNNESVKTSCAFKLKECPEYHTFIATPPLGEHPCKITTPEWDGIKNNGNFILRDDIVIQQNNHISVRDDNEKLVELHEFEIKKKPFDKVSLKIIGIEKDELREDGSFRHIKPEIKASMNNRHFVLDEQKYVKMDMQDKKCWQRPWASNRKDGYKIYQSITFNKCRDYCFSSTDDANEPLFHDENGYEKKCTSFVTKADPNDKLSTSDCILMISCNVRESHSGNSFVNILANRNDYSFYKEAVGTKVFDLELNNIILKDGNSQLQDIGSLIGESDTNKGSSIYLSGSELKMQNVEIKNNKGKASIWAKNGKVNILNSIIKDNEASDETAGIYVNDAELNVELSEFKGNKVLNDGNFGSAVKGNSNKIDIFNTIFKSNSVGDEKGKDLYFEKNEYKVVNPFFNNNNKNIQGTTTSKVCDENTCSNEFKGSCKKETNFFECSLESQESKKMKPLKKGDFRGKCRVKHECVVGYEGGKIKCEAGNYNIESCKPKKGFCNQMTETIDNSKPFNCSNVGTDEVCPYECEDGYKPDGTITCKDTATYDNKAKCVSKCKGTLDIANANMKALNCDMTPSGGICNHECKTGYSEGQIVCNDDTFSVVACTPTPGVCGTTGGRVQQIKSYDCSNKGIGDTCSHICDPGYTRGSVICNEDGPIVDNCIMKCYYEAVDYNNPNKINSINLNSEYNFNLGYYYFQSNLNKIGINKNISPPCANGYENGNMKCTENGWDFTACTQIPAVNCEFSCSEWSSCNPTTKRKQRTCDITQQPQFGGTLCPSFFEHRIPGQGWIIRTSADQVVGCTPAPTPSPTPAPTPTTDSPAVIDDSAVGNAATGNAATGNAATGNAATGNDADENDADENDVNENGVDYRKLVHSW